MIIWRRKFIGSVTDPYQPCERKYERTRTLLKQLQGSGISVSIATRSDLVLRDIDLIRTFPNARVAISINTVDEEFRKEMDRGATIEKRLDQIYSKKSREYWSELDIKLRKYAEKNHMPYVRDDDSKMSDFGEPPIMANYFYHEEVKKSAKKK